MGSNKNEKILFNFERGGNMDEIYNHDITEEEWGKYVTNESGIAYAAERDGNGNSIAGTYQKKLAKGSNTVSNLDDLKNGVMWFNAANVESSTTPIDSYGNILSLGTVPDESVNSGFQLMIPYTGNKSTSGSMLRYRCYTNSKWQPWVSAGANYENFSLQNVKGTMNAQTCWCNLSTGQVHIVFFIDGITGVTGGQTICTVPSKYAPATNQRCLCFIAYTTTGALNPAYGSITTSGALAQNCSSQSIGRALFYLDYYIA